MSNKINRKVVIDGQTKWIRADSEQDYFEKIQALTSSKTVEKHKRLFNDYAIEWFELYSKPNIKTVTAATYKRQLDKYILPAFENKFIDDIKTNDVQRLFNDMGNNLAKETKKKVKTVLNQIFENAVDDGLIIKNPLNSKRLKIEGKKSQPTKTYTVEQMQYITKHIDDIKKDTDMYFVSLICMHPLRLEEVLGLKWCDIDFENQIININRAVTHPLRNQPEIKETKTEESQRTIALTNTALKYLPHRNENGFIFGGKKAFSYTQLCRMCDRIKKDINFDENITPQRFRTTVLSDIYDQTKDIKLTQKAAGHTTAAMTLKYYVKSRSQSSETAAAIDTLYSQETA